MNQTASSIFEAAMMLPEPERLALASRLLESVSPEVDTTPSCELHIHKALDRLATLPRDWDREGADPIHPAIIQSARTFVARLPKGICGIPAVVPMAAGNLQFEWNKGPRSLELEIETPTTIRFLKWHPEAGIEQEESFDIADIARAVALIHWVEEGEEDA